MAVRFLRSTATVACCRLNGLERGSAVGILSGKLVPGREIIAAATVTRAQLGTEVGRVIAAGKFTDQEVFAQLAAALPAPLAALLRPNFEWYGCRGAAFHNDAHYADVLFGAWCLAGPDRALVFPRLALSVPTTPGDFVVFDPFEPHGVLRAGQTCYARTDYENTQPSLFLAFELQLAEAARERFGVGAAPAGATELSSRAAVNAETGAVAAAC